MDVLRRALEVSPPDAQTLHAWWEVTRAERERWSTTIDRAVIGGALADRMGFAFAGGYHEALQRLMPGLHGVPASLCATEEGGNHPRAIKTTLTRVHAAHYALNGRKAWATAASDSTILLVIASTGEHEGKNRLSLVSVRAGDRGVKLTPTSASFVPEISHAVVEFDNVTVSERDVHAGDGYDDYLKPFRTIEDLHVHGALLGYLLGAARRNGLSDFAPRFASAIATTRALVADDPKADTTHLALGGLLDQVTQLVADLESLWPSSDERTRWNRDRKILQVAGSARTARLARARERLGVA